MQFLQKNYYRIRNLYRRVRGTIPQHPPPEEFYQRLCDIVVGDVCIRVSEFDGDFRLDPRSHLFKRCLLLGFYEPHLVRLCRAFAQLGGDFLDIGANVGFYSVFMAQQPNIGKVLAAEPVEITLRRLKENLKLNHVENQVILFEGALTDRTGDININVPVGNEEFSSPGKMTHIALKAMPQLDYIKQTAPTTTLDDLVAAHRLKPCLLKIDTEGSEHLAFAGGLRTLREHHPAIIAELNDQQLRDNGSSALEVMEMIFDCGYSSHDVSTLDHSKAIREYGNIMFVADADQDQQRILESLRSESDSSASAARAS